MDSKSIKIEKIFPNTGQIQGLPQNPRFIRDKRYEELKKSIEDAPEMLSLRELIVYPFEDKFVVIGGNMRLRACKDLGYREIPCKVLPVETPVEKLREYTIKDNNEFGQNDWDILANEWEVEELNDWGLDDIFKDDKDDNLSDLDRFFEEVENITPKADSENKISIIIPNELVNEKTDIINKIKELLKDYPKIQIL